MPINPYDDLVAQLAKERTPTVPATGAPPSPYDALVRELTGEQETRTRIAQGAGAETPPGRASEALQIALRTGLPPSVVERNFDDIKRRMATDEAVRRLGTAPTLARWAEDPIRAAATQDDLPSLVSLDGLLRVGRNVSGSLGAGLLGLISGGFGAARAYVDVRNRLRPWTPPPPTTETPLPATALDVPRFLLTASGHDMARFMGTAADVYTWLADTVRGEQRGAGFVERAVYSGLESVAQMAPGIVLSGGTATVPLAVAGLSTYGQSYQAARQQGVSVGKAAGFASFQGAVEVATEFIPAQRYFTDLAKRPGLVPFLMHQLAAEIPGEELATVLQDFGEWATLPANTSRTLGDYWRERPSAAAGTLISVLVSVGATTGATVGVQHFIERLGEEVKQSKTAQRSPELLKEFVDQATEGGAQTLYAPLESWNTYWREKGLDPANVAKQVTGSPEAYRQATDAGTDLELPLGAYAATLAGTEHNAFFATELKLSPDAPNARELDTLDADMTAELDALLAAQTDTSDLTMARDTFHAGVVEQLVAAGEQVDEAQAHATLIATGIETLSLRAGVNAFAENAVVVQPEVTEPGEGETTREQRAQTASPAFRAWFGNSTTVDATGTPRVYYHGTARSFTAFSKTKATDTAGRRLGMGWGRGKFYFADSGEMASHAASGAGFFGKGRAAQVLPVYLKIDKPISDTDYLARVAAQQAAGRSRDAAIALVDRAIRREGYDGIVSETPGGVAVFEPTQIKSATGNRGTFSPTDESILNQAAPVTGLDAAPAERKDGALLVSTRFVTGTKNTPAQTQLLETNLAAMVAAGPEKVEQAATAFRSYSLLTAKERATKSAAKVLRVSVDAMKRNLRALWDRYPTPLAQRAAHWYVGANRIANELAADYGYSTDQVAGVLAALSPQLDWFRNVSLADRVLQVKGLLERENRVFTATDLAHFATKAAAATEVWIQKETNAGNMTADDEQAYRAERAEELAKLEQLVGTAWADLSLFGKTRFLRAVDEQTNPRAFAVISPEGDRLGPVLKKDEVRVLKNDPRTSKHAKQLQPGDVVREVDGQFEVRRQGEPAMVGWNTYVFIENALSILEDGSPENISERLGPEHKVRSFYNNISHPWDARSVTIDTHTVAAAFLQPFSSYSREVMHAMGSKMKGDRVKALRHSPSGISGTNAIIAQAYFELAEERGVLPRELQSVMWEAVGGLFRPEQKRSATGKALAETIVSKISSYTKGAITHEQLVTAIVDAAGSIEEPAWRGQPVSEQGALATQSVLPRQPDLSAGRGDRGGDTEGLTGPRADQREGVLLGALGRGEVALNQQAARVGYDSLLARVREPGGGFTYSTVEGAYRTTGVALAVFPERAAVLDVSDVTVDRLAAYLEQHDDVLSQPGNHFGAWHNPDDGKVYLDVSRVVATEDEAQALGREYEQIAAFSLDRGEAVPIVYPEGWQHGATWQGPRDAGALSPPVGGAERGDVGEARRAADGTEADTGGAAGRPGVARPARLAAQGIRGQIRYAVGLDGVSGRRFTITLTANANRSTFFHETGHFFLEVMRDLANRPTAAPSLIADLATLEGWLGQDEDHVGPGFSARQHERFARAFEAYLMEGRAPSVQLRSVFAQARAWLVDLYRSLVGLEREAGHAVDLSDEVRAVMDRLLATDDAIAEAQRAGAVQPVFETAAAAWMSEDAFATYQRQVETEADAATQALQGALLEDVRREEAQAWREERAQVREAVMRELQAQPVYQAMAAIRYGTQPDGTPLLADAPPMPLRLSRADLEAADATAEQINTLRAKGLVASTDGERVVEVAELFGFDSADALVRALVEAPALARVARAETARRMQARHPDLLHDAPAVRARAEEAVSSAARETRVRAELSAMLELEEPPAEQVLAQAQRPPGFVPREELRQAVRERRYEARWKEAEAKLRIAIAEGYQQVEIDRLAATVRDLRAQARRGAATIRRALPSDETLKAYAAQRIAKTVVRDLAPRTFLAAATRASRAAIDAAARQELGAAIRAKQTELLNLKLYQEATRVARDLERRVRAARALTAPAARRRIGLAGGNYLDQVDGVLDRFEFAAVSQVALDRRAALANFVAGLEAQGLPVTGLPPILLEESRRTHYSRLTVDELVEVTDGLTQLVHLARLKNRLLRAQADRAFAEVRDEIVTTIVAQARDARPVEFTPQDEVARLAADWFASHQKLAQIVQSLDGYAEGGPLARAVLFPLNEAANSEEAQAREAGAAFAALFDTHYGGLTQANLRQRIYIEEIGQSLSREAIIAVGLNSGNEDNRSRLVSDPSRNWTEAQVDAIREQLTETDWNFIQGTWDLIDSYWPAIAEKQERVTGLAPEKVSAVPVQTRFGVYRGGYYPLAYDGRLTPRASQNEAASDLKLAMAAAYVATTTKRGHTQERLNNVQLSVRLDLGVAMGHLHQVIHDLTHHETLIDVTRVLRDGQVARAILDARSDLIYKQLTGILQDIAVGPAPARNVIERAATYMRTGTQIALLGWNLWTALQQPLGIFNGMARVGPKWVARGMGRWLRDASSLENTVTWITDRSVMMRHRAVNATQDLHDLRAALQQDGGWFDMLLRSVSHDRVTQQALLESYMWHIGLAQRVADVPTWLGAYEKAMAADADEARAIALADQAVLDSQGGGQMKDLAGVQRGGPAARLFMTFYSYGNTVFNATAREIGKFNQNRSFVSAGELIGNLSLIYVMPAFGTVLLAHGFGRLGGDEDWQAWLEEVGAELLSGALNTMVLVRELQGLVGEGTRGYAGPAGARAIGALYNAGVQVKQGEADAALFRALNTVGGILFRYPAAQMQRTVDGVVALMEGRTTNPLVVVTGPARAAR